MQTQQLINRISNDRIHGSSELAIIALQEVAELAQQNHHQPVIQLQQQFNILVDTLQNCRPSMVALNNLLQQIDLTLDQKKSTSLADYKIQISSSCNNIITHAQTAQQQVITKTVELIKPGDSLMTHSLSSTIKNIFAHLARFNIDVDIYVTESRPGDEGKLLAKFLTQLKLNTHYLTEAQINIIMPRVDKVIVGADAILADGAFINKCGTSLLALSAQFNQVPFYVCAESFKQLTTDQYSLEKMPKEELNVNQTGLDVLNYYFERTPAELVSRWIH